MRNLLAQLIAAVAASMQSHPFPKPETPVIEQTITLPATTRSDADHLPVKVPVLKVSQTAPSKNVAIDPQILIRTFASYVGIKESPMGSNNGPMVNKFNQSCGLDPSEHAPWCAAATHYGYAINGLKNRPGAYSPDWYVKARRIAANDALAGDTCLVWFPSKGRYAHTIACIHKVIRARGIVTAFETYEGNTNAQGSREGDQFADRVRPADSVVVVRWWTN